MAGGYICSIRIKKVDADTGVPLQGAVFKVTRTATGTVIGTVFTNDNGEASLGGLLRADYEIEEIQAPDRYEKLADTITVHAQDFGDDDSISFIIDNHRETTSLQVVKHWVGPAAGPVTVELTRFDPATGDYVPTGSKLVLSDDNDWSGVFQNLRKYDDNDQLIEYHVMEAYVPGYAVSIDYGEPGAAITNTNVETIDIVGSKTWNDSNNQDGARPDSITVRLRAGNNEVDSKVVTAGDGWSWAFTGLPKYDSVDGREITYSITEDAVAGYSASYSGYDVTNAHTPGKTSLTVSKAWDDGGKDSSRPADVTIRLFADGVDTGSTLVLNAANNWTGSFEGLDERRAGEKVVYTVVEDAVDGYTAKISGDAEKGFTVTNVRNPQEPTPPTPSKTRAPKTGDAIDPAPIAALAAASFGALAIALYCGKRRRGRE